MWPVQQYWLYCRWNEWPSRQWFLTFSCRELQNHVVIRWGPHGPRNQTVSNSHIQQLNQLMWTAVRPIYWNPFLHLLVKIWRIQSLRDSFVEALDSARVNDKVREKEPASLWQAVVPLPRNWKSFKERRAIQSSNYKRTSVTFVIDVQDRRRPSSTTAVKISKRTRIQYFKSISVGDFNFSRRRLLLTCVFASHPSPRMQWIQVRENTNNPLRTDPVYLRVKIGNRQQSARHDMQARQTAGSEPTQDGHP